MGLRKLPQLRAFVKFIDCLLGEVKAATNVHSFKPALFPPAPHGAGGNAYLFAPRIQTDNRPEMLFGLHNEIVSHFIERNRAEAKLKNRF